MADEILQRDQNHVPVIGLITDDVSEEVRMGRIDDATKAMKVTANFPGNTDGQIKITSADTTFGYIGSGKFVAGTGITLTVNNPGANETLTISAASAGYNTIQEDGTPFTQRTVLNFTHGFDVTDSAVPARTNVAIDESELDLGLMGGLLDLSTQITGLLDATYIDQSSLDLGMIGGLLDLSTQVTGLLSSTYIDITDLESTLDLANIAGQIDLTAQVTGVLPLANGGSGSALTDPGYDAIWVWDDTTNTTRLADLVGLTYDSVTNTLTASGTPYSLDVQQDGVSVETGVNTINFTGNVLVTNPSSGQVDVQIGANILNVTVFEDFLNATYETSGASGPDSLRFLYSQVIAPGTGDIDIVSVGSETNHPGVISMSQTTDGAYLEIFGYDSTLTGGIDVSSDFKVEILTRCVYNSSASTHTVTYSIVTSSNQPSFSVEAASGTNALTYALFSITGSTTIPATNTWFKAKWSYISGTLSLYIDYGGGYVLIASESGSFGSTNGGNITVEAFESGSGNIVFSMDYAKLSYQVTR